MRMAAHREPRRANLATIVGSSLAVVAAGSLLAFSTLAEQAGLQGLATGRIDPAHPGRFGGGGHAITIPAPAPPEDPRDDLAELVRETVARRPRVEAPVVEVFTPAETPSQPRPRPERPRRIDQPARVAVAPPAEVEDEPEEDRDGPPYGHAYGYYRNKHEDGRPAKKDKAKPRSAEQPVYARSANDEPASKPPKAPKMKKVKPAAPGNGKAQGHSKHGKGNGHSKHAHKGKGKGHSKHGG
jgi:hypothetical protein